MKMELFKNIKGVYFYDDEELKVTKNSQGYCYVTILNKKRRLHRILALLYVDNPKNLPIVDHIDNDKTNNKIDNLQWISYSDNSKKAYATNKRMKNMHKLKASKNRVIVATCPNGIETVFTSTREAAKYLNRDPAGVFRCLNGEWKKCNKHTLIYK